MKNRLAKILAAAGVASRRQCEQIIFEGRVTVNGDPITLPQTIVDSEVDTITVDGSPLKEAKGKVYYVLNKPKGYLCSNRPSPHGKRVIDLFADLPYRLFTVGRLDKETTGLLIVTNDGDYANRVIHPSSGLTKEYLVKTRQEIGVDHLECLKKGTYVEGVYVRPVRVTKVRRNTIKIVISEGKKREVRLLVKGAGLNLIELKRIRIGNLHLGKLPIGSRKSLTQEEAEHVFD